MEPLFSIIVPVYKVEEYLRPCVDSILAQTFPALELILVDDGSPDGCGAICDEYARQDGRVTVLHRPNGGVTAARRAGLDRAGAEYVCFVDGDDTVAPDWLESVLRCAGDRRPDVFLFGHVQGSGKDDGKERPPCPKAGYYDKARLQAEIYPYMLFDRRGATFGRFIPGFLCMKIFRRDILLAHFIEDERITMFEDAAMSYECLYAARDMYVCPVCPYFYRQRPGSAIGSFFAPYLPNVQRVQEYLAGHLGRQAPELAGQINAYAAMRVVSCIAHYFSHGLSFSETLSRFREGMEQTGLYRSLLLRGLPAHMKLFVLLLKCRAYAAAVALVRLRV